MTIATRTSTLNARLRAARQLAGLDQAELAATLGVSRNSISNWEGARAEIPATALIRWSEITGVSLKWLAWGADVRPEGFEPPTF